MDSGVSRSAKVSSVTGMRLKPWLPGSKFSGCHGIRARRDGAFGMKGTAKTGGTIASSLPSPIIQRVPRIMGSVC